MKGGPIRIPNCGIGPECETVQDVLEFFSGFIPSAKWTLFERADGSSTLMGQREDLPDLLLEFPAIVGNRWTRKDNPEGT